MKCYITRILFFLLTVTSTFAQSTFQISGVVKDDKNQPLAGAQVFISGSQRVTLTNDKGEFLLKHLSPGSYELVVNYLGFHPESQMIVIDNQSFYRDVILKPKNIQLDEVIVKAAPDPMRKSNLDIFKKNFIGRSANADKCEILNPEILKLSYNLANQFFTASADDYLIIENRGLGYRIKYLLKGFEINYAQNSTYYGGFVYFEDLEGTTSEKQLWEKNRRIAYEGSVRHFLRAVYNHTESEQGFLVHTLTEIPNPHRPSDSLLHAKITAITADMRMRGIIRSKKNDSLSYWVNKRSLPYRLPVWTKDIIPMKSFVKTEGLNFKSISFPGQLIVIYTKEKEPKEYLKHTPNSFSLSENGQTSVISLKVNKAVIDRQGVMQDPWSIKTEDYWSWERMADMLPLNYGLEASPSVVNFTNVSNSPPITGTVKDSRNDPVIGAQVFINGTRKFASTNTNGEFIFNSLEPGNYELVINYLGFNTEYKRVILGNGSEHVEIILKEKSILLDEVVVKTSNQRRKDYQFFKENFLGLNGNSKQCEILNPEVLDLSVDLDSTVFNASSDDYLIIENQGLGYRIKYLLTKFELNKLNGITTYQGAAYFEDLEGTPTQQKYWEENRRIAYNGSLSHFLKSVYTNTVEQEGFTVHKLLRVPNPIRLSDSLINSKIMAINEALKKGNTNTKTLQDSLAYWNRMSRLPENVQLMDKRTIQMDTLVSAVDEHFKRIQFKDYLSITYTKEKLSDEYIRSNQIIRNSEGMIKADAGSAVDDPAQTSVISLREGTIVIDKHGGVRNPADIITEKYWTWEKVAEMLPLDYKPVKL